MSTEIDCEQRMAPRVAVRVGGEVHLRPSSQSLCRTSGRKPSPMTLRDISRTGMSFEMKGDELILGMTLTVKVEIRQTECSFPAKVVRIVPGNGGAVLVGVRIFVEVLDSGTRSTLQSLFAEVDRRSHRDDDQDPETTRITRLPERLVPQAARAVGRLRLLQRATTSGI
jgi:hypothetical protein